MRFWLCGSGVVALMLVTSGAIPARQEAAPKKPAAGKSAPKRANELTLAGIQPGKDGEAAERAASSGATEALHVSSKWGEHIFDRCASRALMVQYGGEGKISIVTLTASDPNPPYSCANPNKWPRTNHPWRTGRGLTVGDTCGRTTEVYGEPESRSPSLSKSEDAEVLFYSFDWAGSNIPQSMEITCESKTGKVSKIVLAAASL